MPIPAPLVDSKSLGRPETGRERPAFAPYLVLTIGSGLLGSLGDTGGGMLARLAGPLAFSLSLALWSTSQFGDLANRPPFARNNTTGSLHVRRASRKIYLLLYGLFAAKEIRFALGAPGGNLAIAQVMHTLWPYLAGALPSLILVRVLVSHRSSAPCAVPPEPLRADLGVGRGMDGY